MVELLLGVILGIDKLRCLFHKFAAQKAGVATHPAIFDQFIRATEIPQGWYCEDRLPGEKPVPIFKSIYIGSEERKAQRREIFFEIQKPHHVSKGHRAQKLPVILQVKDVIGFHLRPNPFKSFGKMSFVGGVYYDAYPITSIVRNGTVQRVYRLLKFQIVSFRSRTGRIDIDNKS